MNPGSQVADLILQLMMRGKAGGLPMQASPELTQYIAHAQGGTAPPQIRGNPSAEVLQGPGSGLSAIRNPDFLNAPRGDVPMVSDPAELAALHAKFPELVPAPAVPEFTQSELRGPDYIDPATLASQPGARPPGMSMADYLRSGAEADHAAGRGLSHGITPEDLVTDRLPPTTFRQESPGEFDPGVQFIWYTRPSDGKRIKLDGPFTDDISAQRALRELRDAGLTDPLEVSPY